MAGAGDCPQRARAAAGEAAGLRGFPGAADAIAEAHFPLSDKRAVLARTRLAFEELLLYQVALAQRRAGRQSRARALALPSPGEQVDAWLGTLPFEPTGDQKRAIEAIDADLGRTTPMQRLLMGEVGSGKTVVALYAMLRAVEVGQQAALMAAHRNSRRTALRGRCRPCSPVRRCRRRC